MKKKYRYMITVMLTGVAASVIILIGDLRKESLDPDGEISRNEWGKGAYEIRMKAGFEDEDLAEEVHLIRIPEREYTEEESDILAEKAFAALEQMIPGENPDLDHISGDIHLPLNMEGYPFQIRYDISDDSLMNGSGELLCDPLRTEDHPLTLHCTLFYGKYRYETDYFLTIVPPVLSNDERIRLILEDKIRENMEQTKTDREFILPQEIEDRQIRWRRMRSNNSIYALVFGTAGALVAGMAAEYDEKRSIRKKEENLSLLYASFANKLKLYLISGLNMKKAFLAITEHYLQYEDQRYRDLCSHLKTACHRFRNHVREEEVYEAWGNECRGPYKKLSFLLSVNLKQGNEKLLTLLEEEVVKAQESRRELARKKGDEAGVRMLFPMMLMLLVVMMLIMLPAYLGIL